MDIFHLIKEDHDHVRKMLEELGTENASPQEQKRLFIELKSDLLLHNSVEEVVFYEPLKQDTNLRPLMDQSRKEHDHVEDLLKEMTSLRASDPEWRQKLEQIKKLILQHMEKEEGEVFQKAQEIFQEGHAKNLGERFQELKETMLQDDDLDMEDDQL